MGGKEVALRSSAAYFSAMRFVELMTAKDWTDRDQTIQSRGRHLVLNARPGAPD